MGSVVEGQRHTAGSGGQGARQRQRSGRAGVDRGQEVTDHAGMIADPARLG
jgi:hypothetical protein